MELHIIFLFSTAFRLLELLSLRTTKPVLQKMYHLLLEKIHSKTHFSVTTMQTFFIRIKLVEAPYKIKNLTTNFYFQKGGYVNLQ